MENFQAALNQKIAELSDKNYDQTLAFFRLWFEIGRTQSKIPSDPVLGALRAYRSRDLTDCNPIDPRVPLILRFASDAESDHILAPYSTGLQSRLCAETLQLFFDTDLGLAYNKLVWNSSYDTHVGFLAHYINLGYVGEAVIRDHILQSLISHSTLHDHHAYALVVLFKIAGATLAAYVDPTVIDRCFELLKVPRTWPKRELIQVNTPPEGSNIGTETNSRRSLSCGSVVGRVFLPHPYSEPGVRNQLARTRKTLLRLQLSHPLDFRTEILNLRSHIPLNSRQSLSQCQTWLLDLPSLSLRHSASPACPTSPLQIPLTTSLLSTPRPQPLTIPSTSRTGTLKCCVATRCSASIPASCHSTLLYSVRCSRKRT